MFRRDYLMRQIQELAEAMKRIAGLQREARHVAALQEAGETYRLFDVDEGLLRYMDATSLVRLLAHRERVDKLVELLELEVKSCEDPVDAEAKRQRAADLRAALEASGLT